MTINEIKELIHVVNESGIAELEVQRGDDRVRIRRTTAGHHDLVLSPGMPNLSTSSPTPQPAPTNAIPAPVEPPKVVEPENLMYVKSPIVGTFYESPTPGAAAFIKVGDRVSPGQTLCIIESMKLMNDIESEVSGIIVSKLVENGRPVEYGESLFAVRPL